MKLIIGLGNPGEKYQQTRHNAGFLALDNFYETQIDNFSPWQEKSEALISIGKINQGKVILIKPQTFMNNSSQAVRALVKFWKVNLKNILVMYDDLALPLGTLRLRPGGSAGGHNGMGSIIKSLKTDEIHRLRIGTNSKTISKLTLDAAVMSKFSPTELKLLKKTFSKINLGLTTWASLGMIMAMNVANV